MSVELQPQHSPMIAKFCDQHNITFSGEVETSNRKQFAEIWAEFSALKIAGETARITEIFQSSFDSHRARISGQISGYELGLVGFKKCWEALGWAIAWYYQCKLKMIPNT